MKTVFIDVMLRDRFVCTLRFRYCPLFAISINEIKQFVESKRPSLIGKPYRIVFDT